MRVAVKRVNCIFRMLDIGGGKNLNSWDEKTRSRCGLTIMVLRRWVFIDEQNELRKDNPEGRYKGTAHSGLPGNRKDIASALRVLQYN